MAHRVVGHWCLVSGIKIEGGAELHDELERRFNSSSFKFIDRIQQPQIENLQPTPHFPF